MTMVNYAILNNQVFGWAGFFPSIYDLEGYHVFPSLLITPPDLVKFFHCDSVTFSFFTGRHTSPVPSNIPFPVIATFSRFFPYIGDMHLTVLFPSKLVSIRG